MIIRVRLRRLLMKKPILGLAAHQATKLVRPALAKSPWACAFLPSPFATARNVPRLRLATALN
jgi:hypothetical protein